MQKKGLALSKKLKRFFKVFQKKPFGAIGSTVISTYYEPNGNLDI